MQVEKERSVNLSEVFNLRLLVFMPLMLVVSIPLYVSFIHSIQFNLLTAVDCIVYPSSHLPLHTYPSSSSSSSFSIFSSLRTYLSPLFYWPGAKKALRFGF